ncbi:LOW QUALITY PROTEIN: hypothetical protein SETIT_5G209900v2 [Setaria italica]|uniref:Uncharacterized protein n=1 Tax=Setaria italica TaxID=4555 RepID=A0A368R733_SETIT|nr:LOW QUALITY PROTEIN: hypothetical protein SETIT_5G209900v2 [Setaria italica]
MEHPTLSMQGRAWQLRGRHSSGQRSTSTSAAANGGGVAANGRGVADPGGAANRRGAACRDPDSDGDAVPASASRWRRGGVGEEQALHDPRRRERVRGRGAPVQAHRGSRRWRCHGEEHEEEEARYDWRQRPSSCRGRAGVAADGGAAAGRRSGAVEGARRCGGAGGGAGVDGQPGRGGGGGEVEPGCSVALQLQQPSRKQEYNELLFGDSGWTNNLKGHTK